MRKIVTIFCMLVAMAAVAATGRVYKGTSTSYLDIVYTYDSRHIYKGTSTSYLDIVYTYDDRHVYEGTSTSYLDIIYTFDGGYAHRAPASLFAILK